MTAPKFEADRRSVVICLGLLTYEGRTPRPPWNAGPLRVDRLHAVDVVFRAALRGVVGAQRETFEALPWYSLAYADPAANTDEQGQSEAAAVITVALGGAYTAWTLREVAAVLAEVFDQRSVAVVCEGTRFVDRWSRDGSDRNAILAVDAGARAGALGLDAPSFEAWPYGCATSYQRAAERAAALVGNGFDAEHAIKATTDAVAVAQVQFVVGGGQ